MYRRLGFRPSPRKRNASPYWIFLRAHSNDEKHLGTSGKHQPVPSVCIGRVVGFHGQLHVAKDCLGHVFPKTSAAHLGLCLESFRRGRL